LSDKGVTYGPEALKHVQVDIVLGELVVDTKVGIRRSEHGGIGQVRDRHRGPATEERGEVKRCEDATRKGGLLRENWRVFIVYP
jgi:hypothetical protein